MVLCNVVGSQITARIVVAELDTILEFKEKIQAYLAVEVARQRLFYDKQNLTLQDSETVSYYGIQNDPEPIVLLYVEPLPGNPKFPVTIRMGAREETLNVKETYKVEDLKWKIGRRWGIMNEHSLTLTRLYQEMSNEATLFEYYVHEGCVINVTITPILPR